MKLAIAIGAVVALSACSPSNTSEGGSRQKLRSGEVTQIAVAPDGTKLWAVRYYGRDIFFASTGTGWETKRTVSCGRNCTRTETDHHQVPLAQ